MKPEERCCLNCEARLLYRPAVGLVFASCRQRLSRDYKHLVELSYVCSYHSDFLGENAGSNPGWRLGIDLPEDEGPSKGAIARGLAGVMLPTELFNEAEQQDIDRTAAILASVGRAEPFEMLPSADQSLYRDMAKEIIKTVGSSDSSQVRAAVDKVAMALAKCNSAESFELMPAGDKEYYRLRARELLDAAGLADVDKLYQHLKQQIGKVLDEVDEDEQKYNRGVDISLVGRYCRHFNELRKIMRREVILKPGDIA